MNYLYFLQQRNLAILTEDAFGEGSKETTIKNVLKYDYLMRIEFQQILDTFGKTELSLINLYKSVSIKNRHVATVSYTIAENNYNDYNKSSYLTDDEIISTPSKTLLYTGIK